MRFLFVFLMVICSGSLAAQSLTGIWRGKRTQGSQGCFPEYFLELHIYYSNETTMMGNAYSYVDNKQFTKVNFTGRYNPLNKRMVISESAVLQYSVPANCIPCIKVYDLTWSKNGVEEVLLGDWRGHEMGNNNACPPGKISLNRVSVPTFPVDIYQSDTLLKLQQNLKLQSREKEVVQTVVIDSPTVKIELYDNAEIDDDTVSVLLNNTLLLHKKRLTDKPLPLQFTAFPNTEYELMMYAENLGRIPPNTALMVITVGKKRYEVRLSSSEQKSAVVKFKYKSEP
ncbi:MAG: hypothetical protein J7621_05655 [Niastella sp.]|nr:hypothetical protein [Niastella sp.]